MRAGVVLRIARTAFTEFARTPAAVFWTYGFPLVMALSLGIAFSGGEVAPIRAVVAAETEAAAAIVARLEADSDGRIDCEVVPGAVARQRLTLGEFDVLVHGALPPLGPLQVEVDLTRPEAELARLWIERALRAPSPAETDALVTIEPITARGSRYIDFLIPGLIGINLLGAGLYGVGFNLVNMRVRHMLRRLYVTPMRPAEFLVGYLSSRLVLVIPESLVVVLFGMFVFDVPVNGSMLVGFGLVASAALAFSGLGLLAASRARTTETMSGLINLVMLPMWILGGSFFSNARFPDFLQPLIHVLPLHQFNEGLRAVMLGGAGFTEVWASFAWLLGTALASFALAVRIFRWS